MRGRQISTLLIGFYVEFCVEWNVSISVSYKPCILLTVSKLRSMCKRYTYVFFQILNADKLLLIGAIGDLGHNFKICGQNYAGNHLQLKEILKTEQLI